MVRGETTEGAALMHILVQFEERLGRNVSRRIKLWIITSHRSALPPARIAEEKIVGDAVHAQSYFPRSVVLNVRK